MDATVVGGLYWERCLYPARNSLYGSGGRAACCLAILGHEVHLHTAADEDAIERFSAHAATFQSIGPVITPIVRTGRFFYSHPLAIPIVRNPILGTPSIRLEVEAGAVLCFGMLEAELAVRAERVVYDPQSHEHPAPFTTIGSAKELVIILNEVEAKRMSGQSTLVDAARSIAVQEGARGVIVKRGPRGCLIWTEDGQSEVPCYRVPKIFKIGSGDVFSAVFFHEWALNRRSIGSAAAAAARATSIYCGYGDVLALQIEGFDEAARSWSTGDVIQDHGGVYIAAPFFTTAERWVVAEVYRVLKEFGLPVFSPFHDVGLGSSSEIVAQDLAGLKACSMLLALADGCDPGAFFEIGFAQANGIGVVVLAENTPPDKLTMPQGTGAVVLHDLAAALYACCWSP